MKISIFTNTMKRKTKVAKFFQNLYAYHKCQFFVVLTGQQLFAGTRRAANEPVHW